MSWSQVVHGRFGKNVGHDPAVRLRGGLGADGGLQSDGPSVKKVVTASSHESGRSR